MTTFNVTSKIAITSPAGVCVATIDKEADFDQIVLRIRKGEIFVNFRVVNLGSHVSIEFWDKYRMNNAVVLPNDNGSQSAFQTMMELYFK